MEQKDFDELIDQVRLLGTAFARAYQDITGEDLNIEGVIRHYPIVLVGVAAGAGAVGGWFLARRGRKQLPPAQPMPSPLEYVERLLPDGLDRVRELLPEKLAEEAAASARTWVDEVLEPSIKEGLETVVSNVEHTRFGNFLKQTLERLEGGDDHLLEDPE